MRTRVVGAVTALALVLSVLAVGAVGPITPANAAGGGTVDLTGSVPATFTLHPGVEQLTVTGGPVRQPLTLVDAATLERIVTLYTDTLGQLTFQYVPNNFLVHDPQTQGVLPTVDGSTLRPQIYRVISEGVPGEPFVGPVQASPAVDVPPCDHPIGARQPGPQSGAHGDGGVQPGSPTRTTTAPGPATAPSSVSVTARPEPLRPGPYPTLVQYSGCPSARYPAAATPWRAPPPLLRHVGVVRGGGCSGGVFRVQRHRPPTATTSSGNSRQPWAKNHKVDDVCSRASPAYGRHPPAELAAITPLSVISPWYQQWPALNAGFTKQWLAQRDDEAAGGAQWVKDRLTGGDTVCEDNLKIRSQSIPFEQFAKSLERRPADAARRNISLQVRDITVPVFLTGAWQDEQPAPVRCSTTSPTFLRAAEVHRVQQAPPRRLAAVVRWFEFLGVSTQVPWSTRSCGPVGRPRSRTSSAPRGSASSPTAS
jgi:hypothetical protein